ncbi:hypothetical protein [Paracoccus sp. MKU1]|uniref:hypothetical protein n=1 Tax=Paracoccus sp. MKU1 TaxID=1745182 RepID=UPI0007246AD2|nr:hypothetical protein [Paracoccus sp. MKU1]KRW94321.1 hypothetical protein AQY21_20545 [Paracoccus sp. MKU1]
MPSTRPEVPDFCDVNDKQISPDSPDHHPYTVVITFEDETDWVDDDGMPVSGPTGTMIVRTMGTDLRDALANAGRSIFVTLVREFEVNPEGLIIAYEAVFPGHIIPCFPPRPEDEADVFKAFPAGVDPYLYDPGSDPFFCEKPH